MNPPVQLIYLNERKEKKRKEGRNKRREEKRKEKRVDGVA
jgi:hypothetical protein